MRKRASDVFDEERRQVIEGQIRVGNATKQLHGDDMLQYAANHWGDSPTTDTPGTARLGTRAAGGGDVQFGARPSSFRVWTAPPLRLP